MRRDVKDLLLKDLCARLPHGVIVEFVSYECEEKPWFGKLSCKSLDYFIHDVGIVEIKPYLRPMSSMTDEEKREYNRWKHEVPVYHYEYGDIVEEVELFDSPESFEYLIENHFDYYGLIEKGLAIEVTKENNPYK